MKAKKMFLMILVSAIPFLAFAQEWDDIYATSKSKESKQKEVKVKTTAPQKQVDQTQVLVVKDNGDITLERTGNVNIDVDAYNRRGDVSVYDAEQAQMPDDSIANADEYKDYEYTDRIVRFHDPANSVKISSDNEINVYVVNDTYSNYYRNRGWNFNVNFGWGWGGYGYYPWYDSWYSPSYAWGWYDPWYYGSWGWGWSRPWYYSSWGWGWNSPWYGGW